MARKYYFVLPDPSRFTEEFKRNFTDEWEPDVNKLLINRSGDGAFKSSREHFNTILRNNTVIGGYELARFAAGCPWNRAQNKHLYGLVPDVHDTYMPHDYDRMLQEGDPPRADSVLFGGNIVEGLEEKNDWVRIAAMSNKNIIDSTPETHPELWQKCTSVTEDGRTGNAPRGHPAWIPIVTRNGDAWVRKERLVETNEAPSHPEWVALMNDNQYEKAVGMNPEHPIGKGMYIWKIKHVTARYGSNEAAAQAAVDLGFSWVCIKAQDGGYFYNQRWDNANGIYVDDILGPFIRAFVAAGVKVWLWGYNYGSYPKDEANVINKRLAEFEGVVEGWVFDPEFEMKGKDKQAQIIISSVRMEHADVPLGYSTYRYPTYHRDFPFEVFARECDFHAPQVYWEQASNSAAQLQRSYNEYRELEIELGLPEKPFIPAGSAYENAGWKATPAQLNAFDAQAKHMGLDGVFYWEWENHAAPLGLLDVIGAHDWGAQPAPPPTDPVPPVPTDPDGDSDAVWNAAIDASILVTSVELDKLRK